MSSTNYHPANKRHDINEHNVNYLYHKLYWSLPKIANHFNCSATTIHKYVKNTRSISEATKLAISNDISYHKGRNNPMFGKSPRWYKIKYKKINFRSSWEVIYAKLFDKMKFKWKYECRRFMLDESSYTPDFYLPDFDVFIEVKGYSTPEFEKKYFEFTRKYPRIKCYIVDGISTLHQMFVLQYVFGSKFTNFGKLSDTDSDVATKEFYVHIIGELTEMLRETNFKHWKKVKQVDRQKFIEELIDVWHFFITVCLIWGVSPKDIYRIYLEKNKENHDRQDKGY